MAESILPKLTVAPLANPAACAPGAALIEINQLSLYYGAARALKAISLPIRERVVTAFIGPSGCGKSTLLMPQPHERPH